MFKKGVVIQEKGENVKGVILLRKGLFKEEFAEDNQICNPGYISQLGVFILKK